MRQFHFPCGAIKLLAVVALLQSGCGFQLRGSEQMALDDNLKILYLSAASPNGDLVRTVRNSLEVSGATIVASRAEAPYELFIDQEKERATTVSVGAVAQATSKNLMMWVSYTLTNSSGIAVAGPEELRVEKLVQHNVLAVNASDREMDIARGELRRKLALQIVRQLRNLPLSPGPATDTPVESAEPVTEVTPAP